MSVLNNKNIIPHVILSFFFALFVNEVLELFFDIRGLMPFYMYGITVVLESMIIYVASKKVLKNWSEIDKYIISILYFGFILSILLGRYGYGQRWIQLNPFACFREFYYGSHYERLIFAFNVVSFVPVPIFFEVFTKDIKKSVILSIILGIGIEVLQLITCSGVFDLSDMLLYFTGICFGYVYMKKTVQ